MQSIYIHHNTIKVVGKLGVNFRWSARRSRPLWIWAKLALQERNPSL